MVIDSKIGQSAVLQSKLVMIRVWLAFNDWTDVGEL